jgi:hypothetical protein
LQKCLHGATLTQVAAIVAKNKSEFYFSQRLLQLSRNIFSNCAVGYTLQCSVQLVSQRRCDTIKLQRKLHCVIAPLVLNVVKSQEGRKLGLFSITCMCLLWAKYIFAFVLMLI